MSTAQAAGAETTRQATAPPRQKTTDRARAERKLAWLLCAPAVIAMLIVTGPYPIGYAVLSFQRYDLRFPDDKEFVGPVQLLRRAHLEHLVEQRPDAVVYIL